MLGKKIGIVAAIGVCALIPAMTPQSAQATELNTAVTNVDIKQDSASLRDAFTLEMDFAVPAGAKEGDTITLGLPEQLWASQFVSFPLKDPTTGDVVAQGKVGPGEHTLVLTLTNYVASRTSVTGHAEVGLFADETAVEYGTPTEVAFSAGRTFLDTITVTRSGNGDMSDNAGKWMGYRGQDDKGSWADGIDHAHTMWGVQGPAISGDRLGRTYIFVEHAGADQKFICTPPSAPFIKLGHYENGGFTSDADPSTKVSYTCSADEIVATLDTADTNEFRGKIPSLMGFSTVAGNPTTLINTAEVVVDGAFYQDVEARLQYWAKGSAFGYDPVTTTTDTEMPVTTPPTATPPTAPETTQTPVTSPPPTPKTPTSTPKTPISSPTPTPTPTPVKHAEQVTRTFQVDTYRRTSTRLARLVPAMLADGRLGYREDRPFWRKSAWEFVTVKVAADATPNTVADAINRATRHSADVTATSLKLPVARGNVTVAWELGRGASTRLPWGPRNHTPQTFVAHS